MKDIRIPGVAWVIAIVILVGLIHSNAAWIESTLHIEPWMVDMAITLLIAGLKTANVGTDQLNQALDVIDAILNRQAAKESAMAHGEAMPVMQTPLPVEDIPERPNKAMRWLVG